jgi:flavin reductase (DIM6/NTAB) family NADH-FMN oxidoreductase RutF
MTIAEQEPEPVDEAAFRDAMRMLPSGVVLVTVVHDGRPWGLTISSCSSLTAEPPQVVLSLSTRTITCQEIERGGAFGLAVLGAEHVALAQAGAAPGVPKFIDDFCDASTDAAAPRVRGARYHLGCERVASYRHGDHTLIVGAPLHATAGVVSDDAESLVYVDRHFRRVGRPLPSSR